MVREIHEAGSLRYEVQRAGDKVVVLDWYSNGCGPCRAIAPQFDRLSKKYQGSAVFLKINAPKFRPLMREHKIKAFPTFTFFRGGQVRHQFSGADIKRVEAALLSVMQNKKPAGGPGGGRMRGGAPGRGSGGGLQLNDQQLQALEDAGIILDIWSDEEDESKGKRSDRGLVEGKARAANLYMCPVCEKEFSKKDMVTHMNACGMLYDRCHFCNMVYEKDKKKEHFATHEKVECECGLMVMRCKLKEHLTRCAARTECPFCGKPHRMRGLAAHLSKCGDTLRACKVCRRMAKSKDLYHGVHTCPPACEYCGERVDAKLMAGHITTVCKLAPTPCVRCGKTFPRNQIAVHKRVCVVAQPKPKPTPQPRPVPQPVTPPEAKWACSVCYAKTPTSKAHCDFCGTPKGSDSSRPPRRSNVDEAKLKQMTDMGIPEHKARSALRATGNNLERAIERSLS